MVKCELGDVNIPHLYVNSNAFFNQRDVMVKSLYSATVKIQANPQDFDRWWVLGYYRLKASQEMTILMSPRINFGGPVIIK